MNLVGCLTSNNLCVDNMKNFKYSRMNIISRLITALLVFSNGTLRTHCHTLSSNIYNIYHKYLCINIYFEFLVYLIRIMTNFKNFILKTFNIEKTIHSSIFFCTQKVRFVLRDKDQFIVIKTILYILPKQHIPSLKILITLSKD